jgi:hypothetical protein
MRTLLPTTLVAALLLPGMALGGPREDPRPIDPDLKLGSSCSGHAKAADRAARLPTEIAETVVLWPRAGKRTVDGACQSVTRFTLVNHTGQIITVSFIETDEDVPTPADGWEVVEDAGPHRARFRVGQDSLGSGGDPADTKWFIESESAPTTSQETLESLLGFFDPAAVARTIITGERPDGASE